MVKHPSEYHWSSYQVNAFAVTSRLITPHPIYIGLASSVEQRRLRYRELFESEVVSEVLNEIRTAAQFSFPLGNDRFRGEIEAALGCSIRNSLRGRPIKDKAFGCE